jgi:hypothetical protein
MRNLLLVPHEISPSPKAEREGMVIELRQVFQSAKHRASQYYLTGDESWFYCTIYRDCMWISDGKEVRTRPGGTTASPKQRLAVFWSPLSFPLVEILPKGTHFHSQDFCSNILFATV